MSGLAPDERLARYGPATGDRVRLADTDLWVRVAEDRQAPGDEPIWGYAKTIRPRIAQGSAGPIRARRRSSPAPSSSIQCIGVVKADIGIKDGRIVGVGRAGNGAISDGIELAIGPHTQPIMGYGLIATPGAVDSHVHTISPALLPAALSGGVTTLITAGFEEPPWAMERTLAGLDGWPVNVGLQAGARVEDDGPPRRPARRRRVRLQDPRGLRRLPGADRPRPPFRRRARRLRLAAHGRPPRVGRARGHRRRDRRTDGPRLPRRGDRRRPRAGSARPRPRAEHPLLLDHADGPVRRQRGGRGTSR